MIEIHDNDSSRPCVRNRIPPKKKPDSRHILQNKRLVRNQHLCAFDDSYSIFFSRILTIFLFTFLKYDCTKVLMNPDIRPCMGWVRNFIKNQIRKYIININNKINSSCTWTSLTRSFQIKSISITINSSSREKLSKCRLRKKAYFL